MASRSIKNRPSIKKKHPFTGVLVAFAIVVGVFGAGIGGVWAMGTAWLQDLPDYTDADAFNTSMPTEVYAADGSTMLARFQLENREPVALEDVSPYVLEGTVSTEDERFYDHGGVDLLGIARAVVVNILGGQEGASTITQQFVRNTILSDEMDEISLKRKVREAYLSIKLEEMYSKDDILLMYLNTINYGAGAYGIQAASQRYFSKDASDLTLAEAAALVGIPQSPTYNSPTYSEENCIARRNLVLDRMCSNGCITEEERDEAQAAPLALVESVPSDDGIMKYPYFTSYVRKVLLENYSQNEVFKGGLKVYTSLDPMMQQSAEAAVANKEEGLDEAIQGALVAIDPDTGFIKAMVGGKNYDASEVNLATGDGAAGRPCGSSFKTFTLVAAIEAGIDPQTLIDCSATAVLPGWSASNPLENINRINYGTRSIARAFAVSSNTGFVRLELAVGIDKVIETAHRMGISSQLSEGSALTLGVSNVTPLEMAEAYATIANGGTHYESTPIVRIENRKGEVIADNSDPEERGERVLSPEVAHAASEVMKGVVQSGEGTGTDARLPSGQVVAAKTGTSENYSDITFCGITPQLSVSIWFGDPQNKVSLPPHVSAGDVFRNFASAALYGQELEDFPEADDPPYQPNYRNEQWHIGGWYSSEADDEDDEGEDEVPVEDPDDPDGSQGGSSDPDDPADPSGPSPNPEPSPDPGPDPGPAPDPAPDPGGGQEGAGGGAQREAAA